MIATAPALILICAAVVALVVTVMGWRRRSIPGGTAFSLMMFSVCIWALGSGIGAAAIGLDRKLASAVFSYIGTVNVAPLFLVFAVRYRWREWRASWWQFALLWLIPLATLVLAATNGLHHLVWTGITLMAGTNSAIYGRGPWYFVAVFYYAALGLASALIIIPTALRAQRIYIRQTVILMTGLAVPWIGTALYLLPIHLFAGLDLPSIGFAVTGILVFFGMTRFRLFDIVPMARDRLVEGMADGLIVIDVQGRIVDMNPSARVFLPAGTTIGGRIGMGDGPFGAALAVARAGGTGTGGMPHPGIAGGYLEIRESTLKDRAGEVTGTLVLIHDLSDRRKLELEREKLIAELTTALSEVRTLQGLLPICSSCRRIRDDSGAWSTLESYVVKNTDAKLTHGLCDDCIRKLYPELADRGPGDSV